MAGRMNAGRAMWGLVAWVLLALPVAAQGFSALARIDPGASRITEAADGGVQIDLGLQIGVPFRIFTLDEPRRLVMDFREVDWTGLTAADLVQTDRVSSVQYGAYVPGWSRMVAELATPMQVATAVMAIDPESAAARLTVALRPVSAQEFAASAGAPYDPQWDLPAPQQVAPARNRDPDAPLVVVLDPGHGGIDPGAEVEGLDEKDLMLRFARELREVLLRSGGFQVVLTRDDDHFVHQEKLTRRDSDASAAGTTAARGTLAAVHWREWRWTTPAAVGDCTWGQVRWRFYDNGRIVFQAEMDNDVGSFKLGAQQGHRIELRTTDGCLLGAWRAAFFVRRHSGIAHYPATVVEEFPLIQQHFDELAERQSGSCFHR